jgi:hypothetical protein
LTGTLSPVEGTTKLVALQVHDNSLGGTIPESLYSNVDILQLRLDQNTFVGPISNDIGALTKLKDLRLNLNFFTGTLPASFINLSDLGKLSFFSVRVFLQP